MYLFKYPKFEKSLHFRNNLRKIHLSIFNLITSQLIKRGFIHNLPLYSPYGSFYINEHYLDNKRGILLFERDSVMSYIIEKHITKDFVCVDVGAHFGYYTLLFSKYASKVYSFEPNPYVFNTLKYIIELNKRNNVILINKAVFNNKGKIKLFLPVNYFGENATIAGKYAEYIRNEYIEVDCITLDEYFYKEKSIDLIKIDAEGVDLFILEGAKETLKKVKILIIEFAPFIIANFNREPKDLLKILIDNEFKIYEINEYDRKFQYIEKIDEFLKYYSIESKKWTNLLCIKKIIKKFDA